MDNQNSDLDTALYSYYDNSSYMTTDRLRRSVCHMGYVNSVNSMHKSDFIKVLTHTACNDKAFINWYNTLQPQEQNLLNLVLKKRVWPSTQLLQYARANPRQNWNKKELVYPLDSFITYAEPFAFIAPLLRTYLIKRMCTTVPQAISLGSFLDTCPHITATTKDLDTTNPDISLSMIQNKMCDTAQRIAQFDTLDSTALHKFLCTQNLQFDLDYLVPHLHLNANWWQGENVLNYKCSHYKHLIQFFNSSLFENPVSVPHILDSAVITIPRYFGPGNYSIPVYHRHLSTDVPNERLSLNKFSHIYDLLHTAYIDAPVINNMLIFLSAYDLFNITVEKYAVHDGDIDLYPFGQVTCAVRTQTGTQVFAQIAEQIK
ncbi:MAG: hypothetical protein K6E51_13370 [Treponema sp.]|nr:hypothetical protein [Treponema sp.]